MTALIVLFGIVAILAVLGAAAIEVGVDSRDGFEDPHGPSHPIGIST